MTSMVYRSSRPNSWVLPRPHTDPHQRYQNYGPVQPMDEPGMIERLIEILRPRR